MERLLTGCKELVLREGFTQFRDTTFLGSGFWSPLGVVVRVEGQQGEVFFTRAELWRQSCPSRKRVFFWNTFLLHPIVRKLVYDAKAFLGSLVRVLPPSTSLPLSLRLVDLLLVRSSCLLLPWLCQDHSRLQDCLQSRLLPHPGRWTCWLTSPGSCSGAWRRRTCGHCSISWR